ncbi:MAG: ABC transporter ATP-binding protein [Lachnospiraceae bacterium]
MSGKEIMLEAVDISRTYKGKVSVHALKKCSLSFEKGEFAAIIGKSGSGKSTLLRLLGTLDIPDSGSIKIAGKDVCGMKDKELSAFRRRNIGFVYQDYNLFPEYTAYENIIFPIHLDGRREDGAEVMDIMEKLGIDYCKDKFPFEMSGGEKQRVSLARALATKPAIILADEPTGNLDAESTGEVAALLRNASDMYNQTIVMVTHDRQMADFADRILTIKDGEIAL